MNENKIVYTEDRYTELGYSGVPSTEISQLMEKEITDEYPMYLGIVNAVNYDTKTDRYIAKIDKSSVKVTNGVAQFLLQHAIIGRAYGPLPTVYARMSGGEIVEVCLRFLSKGV